MAKYKDHWKAMSIFLAYVVMVVGWSALVARLLRDAELHWILQGYLGGHIFAMPHKGLGQCLQDSTVTSRSDHIHCIHIFCIQFWSSVSVRIYQNCPVSLWTGSQGSARIRRVSGLEPSGLTFQIMHIIANDFSLQCFRVCFFISSALSARLITQRTTCDYRK